MYSETKRVCGGNQRDNASVNCMKDFVEILGTTRHLTTSLDARNNASAYPSARRNLLAPWSLFRSFDQFLTKTNPRLHRFTHWLLFFNKWSGSDIHVIDHDTQNLSMTSQSRFNCFRWRDRDIHEYHGAFRLLVNTMIDKSPPWHPQEFTVI